jgi:hypothetical protein
LERILERKAETGDSAGHPEILAVTEFEVAKRRVIELDLSFRRIDKT